MSFLIVTALQLSVTHCHMSPSRAQTTSLNTFPLKLCRLQVRACSFQTCLSMEASSTFQKAQFNMRIWLFTAVGAGLGLGARTETVCGCYSTY